MFVAMVTISSIMLLWRLPQTTSSCITAYSHASHVLINHVIQLFTVQHFPGCTQKCGADSTCHSMNWYPDLGLCELNNATHLFSPEDFVKANHGNYLIYFPHPMAVCSNRWCKDSKTCFMYSDGINYRCHDCGDALGMEDGRITANQITASTTYDSYHAPSMARLHNRHLGSNFRGAWSSGRVRSGEYLQIDLSRVVYISKVATQGRPAELYQWVTKYALQYSIDGTDWSWIQQEHSVKEFPGNSDRDTVVTNRLPTAVRARYIRIVALGWNHYISMRAELYGCDGL